MDPSSYKDVKTARGFNYHYFVSPAQGLKPTLIFLHGFPSSSYDWHFQVDYFTKEGYGVIVPDLLGYGGTDKPTDVQSYRFKGMSDDIIDILNTEQIDKAVAIGHDWGSGLTARLANYHPDRFIAFAFLAVAYNPPPGANVHAINTLTKELFGYETFGYQLWFAAEGTEKVIESHLDSFMSLVFPHDPQLWRTDLAPIGAVERWVTSGKTAPPPSYISETEREKHAEPLRKGGFAGCLNWYKSAVGGHVTADGQNIPKERYVIHQPVFFGAALKDFVCLAQPSKDRIGTHCKNLTVKDYDTDHWVMLAAPDQVNNDLDEWIKSF